MSFSAKIVPVIGFDTMYMKYSQLISLPGNYWQPSVLVYFSARAEAIVEHSIDY
jgi:hypothetical protein